MEFGLTAAGLSIKRLADLKNSLEVKFQNAFGLSINLTSSSVSGQLVGIEADELKELWELLEVVYNSQFPATAEGSNLDNVVSITGITRRPGLKSTIESFLLKGDAGTIVPQGTVFSVDNSPLSRFVLLSDVTLSAGVDEVQTLTASAIPDSGNFSLSLQGQDTITLSFGASASDVQNALNDLPSLASVQVAGAFPSFVVTFTGQDGKENRALLEITNNTLASGITPITWSVLETQAGEPSAEVQVEALEIGAISAPSRSLSVIDNPLTGLDFAVNPSDATVGSGIEDDATLKQRQQEALQTAGAGTLNALRTVLSELSSTSTVKGFENTELTESEGLPPKSFEMVVLGGTDLEIAETIYANKPAGIKPFGSISQVIIDPDGFEQTVMFSRPTLVPIYVELDITNTSEFPADGIDQIKAAIVSFGNTLGVQDDVVVFPKLLCSVDSIPGIIDIDIRVGTSPNPTGNDNVPISASQVSSWDTSRVEVSIV